MIVERDVDCGAIYEEQRTDLLAVAHGLTDDELGRAVPATPAWSVRDVIAHLVGIAADLNVGRLAADDPDTWTAAQVSARQDCSLTDLAHEWAAEAPTFEDGLRLFGYEVGSHFVGDLVQHAADVRHAVGQERITDGIALSVALDFYLDSFHQTLVEHAAGSVEVTVAGERCVVGSGPIVAGVTADRFELLRALGGRRSEAQLRALGWWGDVEPVLPLVSRYPVPRSDLRDG